MIRRIVATSAVAVVLGTSVVATNVHNNAVSHEGQKGVTVFRKCSYTPGPTTSWWTDLRSSC